MLPILLLVGGLYWTGQAFALGIWNGPQPGSGFMPLIYGGLLCLFSAATLLFSGSDEPQKEQGGVPKPLLLLAMLILTVAGFNLIGGVASLFLMMSIMFIAVERLPPIRSLIVAAVVSSIFAIVFDHWLSVSLPHGPWGF
ncbi:MAG TPA: tripartite tricarboxylate transporter TctB family protein [Pseudorhizobium sp.]|nr:tripartite tricarboxylate transporter TctB family protein [Pseudorhizobium sp.]